MVIFQMLKTCHPINPQVSKGHTTGVLRTLPMVEPRPAFGHTVSSVCKPVWYMLHSTIQCTVIATCIMCTLYTRVGAWVSPPEVENELLKCCLYTLQGGVEGGCPPPLSFSFSCPGQYKPCTGPGLGWSGLACFRSFQKSAPDESSRMSHQWWVIPDDSSLMTHQAQTSGSFQSRKRKRKSSLVSR